MQAAEMSQIIELLLHENSSIATPLILVYMHANYG